MPQFLTTSGTSHLIEEVIIKAKTELVLITPYLKLSRILFERLTEANNRGVRIRLVYGKSELHHGEQKQLDALTNIELLFLQNLHAKCYYNEKVLVVSSMNLYEFSEKNNREMGVVLTRRDDEECFADALAEAHSILAAATVVTVRRNIQNNRSNVVVAEKNTEVRQEKEPYDSTLMTQKLFEMLKNVPELGDLFSVETKPHSFDKGKLTATIMAANYPRQGVHFKFNHDFRFDFDSRADYRSIKNNKRSEVERLLGGAYRCYWNQDVIQVYAAKNYKHVDESATAEYFMKAIIDVASAIR